MVTNRAAAYSFRTSGRVSAAFSGVLILGSLCVYLLFQSVGRNPLPSVVLPLPQADVMRVRYLVYDCTFPPCGGWADRLEGITSAYLIALATGRRFYINVTYPVNLEMFLHPSELNWTIDPVEVKNKSTKLYNYMDNRRFHQSLRTMDFDARHPEDIVRVKMNAINSHYIMQNLRYKTQLLPFANQTLSSVFSQIHALLFTFSDHLESRLLAFRQAAQLDRRHKLVCAHIRIGYLKQEQKLFLKEQKDRTLFWKLLDAEADDESVRIFVSSDSPDIVEESVQRYGPKSVRMPGPIDHLDKSNGLDIIGGFWKTLVDFYALKMCDVLLLSPSSFGRLPAFLRGLNDDLFMFQNHSLHKASLQDVEKDYLKRVVL